MTNTDLKNQIANEIDMLVDINWEYGERDTVQNCDELAERILWMIERKYTITEKNND